MRKIVLGDPCHTAKGLFNNYVPLGIVLLAGYVQAELDEPVSSTLFKSARELLAFIQTEKPDVVALSAYLWNTQLSSCILRLFKECRPDGIAVLGGPNFPKCPQKMKDWLSQHSWVDFVIDDEGERAFLNLLKRAEEVSYDNVFIRRSAIPGCFSLSEEGTLLHEPESVVADVEEIPSPYLEGRMDPFLLGTTDGYRLYPLFEGARGCPFHCTFCRNSTSQRRMRFFSAERFLSEIEYVARLYHAKGMQACQIMITDQNFGQFSRDVEIAEGMAKIASKYGFPQSIMVTTGKGNAENVLRTIRAFPVLGMTFSVQSLDEEVLQNIKRRNFPFEKFKQYQAEAKAIGRLTASDVILGLPGDSLEKHLATIRKLLTNDLDIINLYSFMMLPGTPAESDEARRMFDYKTRWRLIPGGFSQVGEKHIFETEEVVVATKTMSSADYLYLRRLHLWVVSVFAGRTFRALKRLLEEKGIDLIDYIRQLDTLVERAASRSSVAGVVREFSDKCRSELFDSPEAVRQYYEREYDPLLEGLCGENLLQKYRYLLYAHIAEWTELLIEGAVQMIGKTDPASRSACASVFDFVRAQSVSIRSLLEGAPVTQASPQKFMLSHDIPKWLANAQMKLEDVRQDAPKWYLSYYSDERLKFFESLLIQFGRDPQGRGKMLHRAGVDSLQPEIEPESRAHRPASLQCAMP